MKNVLRTIQVGVVLSHQASSFTYQPGSPETERRRLLLCIVHTLFMNTGKPSLSRATVELNLHLSAT